MYSLDNRFTRYDSNFNVAVIGCGGTGSFVAEGLCRILPAKAALCLIDFDRVEERNLLRQNFIQAELHQYKTEALAQRLSREFGRSVGYATYSLPLSNINPRIIIGCVDNGLARKQIADQLSDHHPYCWWVDAGNGQNYGQIFIGNVEKAELKGQAFVQTLSLCLALPLPTEQRPDLLAQAPPARSCAELTAAGEQGPTINQVMASLTVEVVRRIINGTCPWMQLYLDMDSGILNPVFATPETVASLTGIPSKTLLYKEKKQERR